jgi:oligopeptide/dipeptide ABC transporter ATP-binding protein
LQFGINRGINPALRQNEELMESLIEFAAKSLDSQYKGCSIMMPLLEIEDLSLDIVSGSQSLRVVDRLSLELAVGETLGLVGESGCGKSMTALAIARLLPTPPIRYAGGTIRLNGRNVLEMTPRELRGIRGRMVGYVFQDPSASLNPVFRVGTQIKECLRLHKPETATDREVIRLLELVRIPSPERRLRDYPFQLSGGMQQRVVLAMALAAQPKLLVADEPTTALDVTIQAQVLELLREIKTELGMSMLLITHNLGLVGEMADRVAVMYAGQIVEMAPARELLDAPRHPYTSALLRAIPRLDQEKTRLETIPGMVPKPGFAPAGCRFHPRCAIAKSDCRERVPELERLPPARLVRCPYATLL